MRPMTPGWLLLSILVTLLFVAIWQLIANAQLLSPIFFPGPDRVWAALYRGLTTGSLGYKFFHTLERMFYGWVLASLAGIAIGALIANSKVLRDYLEPGLELLRPLPASAIVPVAIAVLGLSEGMVLAVIAFGALWPVLLATIHGFSTIEPRLVELAAALGLKRTAFIAKIALPGALPDILAGMRLGLTVSLIMAIVGEMLASRDGLGQWILLSGRAFRSHDVFAGLILLGVLGLLSSMLIVATERWLLRWRDLQR